MRRKFILTLWSILSATILLILIFFVLIWNGWVGYMPDIESLQNPIDRFATQVYSSDGVVIGTWSQNKENRIRVPYDSISKHVIEALVATEDARYYEHSGIDFIAVGRSVVKRGMMGRESAGGGSTITQQLAKQLYSEHAESKLQRILQKPVEWVIALKLERNFTKEEIIAMYLNKFDFLHNAVGIKMAANIYFSKEPIDLTVPESAMLVGLCKNPSLFNPIRYQDRCKERRNVVMQQMVKAGYLSQDDYNKYSKEDIKLAYHAIDHKEGQAPYFREFLRKYMTATEPKESDYPSWGKTQYYIDSKLWKEDPLYGWCNKNKKKDGSYYNIYTDGLKVVTTVNSRMQKYAEDAVVYHVAQSLQPKFNKSLRGRRNAPFSANLKQSQVDAILNRSMRQSERWRTMAEAGYSDEEIRKSFREKTMMSIYTYHGDVDTIMTPLDSIKYYKSILRSGFMSMDPSNGHVMAYVGGLDYMHFQYDMVMLGRRQVGSTIKPFLYSLAMSNGHTPCETAPNVQQTYYVGGRPWTPRNGSRARYGENVTLKWGLQQSNNWISAYLMSKLNPEQFVEMLRKFGIDSPDIVASMALCLGPCEVSVGEMVSAYTTFANNGIRVSPVFVSRIEDSDGNVIAEFEPRMHEVLSTDACYKMLEMLMAVANGGTGSRLRYQFDIKSEIGCKTGTTNRNADAWFIGFTPQLVSGCWVGGEDRDIHFDNTSMGQGAAMALPIWAYYMRRVYRDPSLGYSPDAKFTFPDGFDACGGGWVEVDQIDDGGSIEDVFE